MAIKHKTLTPSLAPGAKISAAQWNMDHDVPTLDLTPQVGDPASPADGMIWYRGGSVWAYVAGSTVDLTAPDWSKIGGKPSTLSGYGISDGITSSAVAAGYQALSGKGVANGYAGLDGTGKVPAAQLPSFVDDVLEFANLAAFPGTGETGKIYVALDTNKTFRWSGSAYVEISPSPGSTDSVTEGSTNLYFTPARAIASSLTGFVTAASRSPIVAADTIFGAFQKAQKYLSDLSAVAFSGAWSDLSGRPTTVSALGLTDAVDTTSAQTVGGIKTFGSQIVLGGAASDPVSPANGSIFLNTTEGRVKVQQGGAAQAIGLMGAPQLVPPSNETVLLCGPSVGSLTTVAGGANRIDLGMFSFSKDIPFAALAINVTTLVASAQARILVYETDANGRPTNKLFESADLNCGVAGAAIATTIAGGGALTGVLLAGRSYFIGVHHSSTATLSSLPVAAINEISGGTTLGSSRKTIRRTVTYGAAPASWGFTSSEVTSNTLPAVWARIP